VIRKLGRFLLWAAAFGLLVEGAGSVSGNGFSLLDAAATGVAFMAMFETVWALPDHVKPRVVRLVLYVSVFAFFFVGHALVTDRDLSALEIVLTSAGLGGWLLAFDVLIERIEPWAEHQRERLDAQRPESGTL
jgi:hypothetical protein